MKHRTNIWNIKHIQILLSCFRFHTDVNCYIKNFSTFFFQIAILKNFYQSSMIASKLHDSFKPYDVQNKAPK